MSTPMEIDTPTQTSEVIPKLPAEEPKPSAHRRKHHKNKPRKQKEGDADTDGAKVDAIEMDQEPKDRHRRHKHPKDPERKREHLEHKHREHKHGEREHRHKRDTIKPQNIRPGSPQTPTLAPSSLDYTNPTIWEHILPPITGFYLESWVPTTVEARNALDIIRTNVRIDWNTHTAGLATYVKGLEEQEGWLRGAVREYINDEGMGVGERVRVDSRSTMQDRAFQGKAVDHGGKVVPLKGERKEVHPKKMFTLPAAETGMHKETFKFTETAMDKAEVFNFEEQKPDEMKIFNSSKCQRPVDLVQPINAFATKIEPNFSQKPTSMMFKFKGGI